MKVINWDILNLYLLYNNSTVLVVWTIPFKYVCKCFSFVDDMCSHCLHGNISQGTFSPGKFPDTGNISEISLYLSGMNSLIKKVNLNWFFFLKHLSSEN